MTQAEIHSRLKSKFGEKIGDLTGELDPTCVVAAESIAEVSEWLRDEAGIDMTSLMCLSGVDYKEKLAVVYNLHSLIHNHKITLKVEFTDRENPHCPSVAGVWGTADWHEREAYDMIGVVFDGHPDLRRILCPDDWEGWPLRKDYKVQETYRGLKVPYPEGLNPDRGHWMFREIPDRRAEAPGMNEPNLDGI